MYKQIVEAKAKVIAPVEDKVSKELPVFYNPVMKLNRDITVLLLNSVKKKDMQIALPLAGTGIRGIRFLLELEKGKIKDLQINDISAEAVKLIKQNLKQNKLKAKVHNKDANLFLLESKGFDFIDIDPFGTPNPFLDAAIRRLSRDGILGVTATDTGCLAGSFPKACERKYWAKPLRNATMHENGLRILIRKVQLIGMQNDKALIPIFSYSKDHYLRVFFRCEKGKGKCDKIVKQHKYFVFNDGEVKVSEQNEGDYAGPLWIGKLWDTKLVAKMIKRCVDEKLKKFLNVLHDESKINTVGSYHIHKLTKMWHLKHNPKMDILLEKINKKKKSARTHFCDYSIRSNISIKELRKLV